MTPAEGNKNLKKLVGLWRALGEIMVRWETLTPAEQCDFSKIAERMIEASVKHIFELTTEFPGTVKAADIRKFAQTLEVWSRMTENIPEHTHGDEPS